MKNVLKKIDELENPTTSNVSKFKSLIDSGLIVARKLYVGPLGLPSGEYRLELTDDGIKLL